MSLEKRIENLERREGAEQIEVWRDDDGNVHGPDGRTLTASQFAAYAEAAPSSLQIIHVVRDQLPVAEEAE